MSATHVTADFALHDLSKSASKLDRATSLAPLVAGRIIWFFPVLGRLFLRAMTRRVVKMHLQAVTYRALVDRMAHDQGLIDEDMTISGRLERMKDGMLKIRTAALRIADESQKIHRLRSLSPIALELAGAAKECYITLCELQEDVEEHDADIAPRVDGFVAHSQKELDDLLERIAAAA